MTTRVPLLLAAFALAACAEAPTSIDASTLSQAVPAGARSGNDDGVVSGETLIGLTDNNELVTFESGKSNQTTNVVAITGLTGGETVVGIDYRPSDTGANGTNDIGKLYAVTTASRLYVVNPVTGAATSPVTLSIALTGTAFGVGFNPAADRLRIHSNSNQNLRINVETGATILDGALAYAAGDVNVGQDPDLTATGYTNNDANPLTGTDLFAIDAARDVLVTFGPATATTGPNSGQLLTVGALGVDADLMSGFDISNTTGTAYAVLGTSASGKSVLYTIDLRTGAATSLGLLAQTKGALLSVVVVP
ncbi:MAG: DUF4394 domain-containing protein [Gemmatimonadota bacterium]